MFLIYHESYCNSGVLPVLFRENTNKNQHQVSFNASLPAVSVASDLHSMSCLQSWIEKLGFTQANLNEYERNWAFRNGQISPLLLPRFMTLGK